MKQLIIIAALFIMSSCEVFNPTMKFKVIGKGNFTIGFSDNGGTSVFNGGEQTFEREMQADETWALSAQSNNGTGVKVEAYIGNERVASNAANGYGVASISGRY